MDGVADMSNETTLIAQNLTADHSLAPKGYALGLRSIGDSELVRLFEC